MALLIRLGRRLLGTLGALLLFGMETGAAEPPITAMTFGPDLQSVVATSQKGVLVYTWPELKLHTVIESGIPNIHRLAFAPSGDQLAVSGGVPGVEGIIEILSWPSGELLESVSLQEDSVFGVLWIDDETLISASLDHSIALVDSRTGSISKRLEGHSAGVSSVAWISDDSLLLSGGRDHTLRVWDLANDQLIRSLDLHTMSINAIGLRPGETGLAMIASASDDRTVRFWQPSIGRMVRFVRLPSQPLDLRWLPDGSEVVVSCADGIVRWIDPLSVQITDENPALTGWAYALAVHPATGDVAVGGQYGELTKILRSNP